MKRKSILAVALSVMLVCSACNAATVQAYIQLAIQIALQVAQLAGVSPVLAQKVSGDLAEANAVYNDMLKADKAAQPGLAAKADALFTTAEADLQAIFTAFAIPDPTGKIQAGVRASLAIAVTAIESARAIAIANAPAPVAAALRTAVRVVPIVGAVVPDSKALRPAQLKALYNHTVAAFPNAQLH
jgi:hypothetical protein